MGVGLRRRTVIHVGPVPPPQGGMAAFIAAISPKLGALGWNSIVHRVGKREGDSAARVPIRDLADMIRFIRLLRGTPRPLVHVHTASAYSFYRSAAYVARAKGKGCYVVLHIHSGKFEEFYYRSSPAGRRLVNRTVERANLVVVADPQQETFIRRGPGPIVPICHIRNGVDLQLFCPGNRDAARQRIGLPQNRIVILSVGALLPVKGHANLIDALSIVATTATERPLLCIVGEGPLREKLRRRAEAANLADCVLLTGERTPDELADWYRAADLYVCASTHETGPIAILEAMASGTPVVSTSVGFSPTLANKLGAHISLVPVGDVEALADAIEGRDWQDADKDNLIGTARQHGWGHVARKVAEAYAQVG